MKKVILALVLLLVVFLTVAAHAQPRYGGTLVCVLPDDPPTLATWLSASFLPRMVAPQIVEGLLSHEPDLTPKPLLAEAWTVSNDGLTWTFKLRKGVKWHDGKPFTADDVVFTVEEVWLKHSPDTMSRWKPIGLTATKVDDNTVVFNFNKAYAFTTNYLSSHFGPIVPKHLFEGKDVPTNPFNLKPVGTGPFKFVEYVKGSHITLSKNPDYWGKDDQGRKLPYLDRIVFRVMPDVTARLLAMEKGEVDYQSYPGFPAEAAKKLQESGLKIGAEPISGLARIQRVFPNHRNKTLSDVRVRRALYHAMNREEILKKAYYGFGKVSIGPLHQGSPLYKDLINYDVPKYEYSPEKANRLLDEAGVKKGADGSRFKLTAVLNRAQATDITIAELLRDYFKAVGVQLEIQQVDEATRQSMVAKRQFDLTMWGPITSGPSPDYVKFQWHSSMKDSPNAFANPIGLSNSRVDWILDNAGTVFDKTKQTQLWKEFQKIMVEEVAEFWLYDALILSARNPDYEGLPQMVWGHYDALSNVWWKKGK